MSRQLHSKSILALAIAAISAAATTSTPVLADSLQLEEVVVTAQKREQSLQDVPIAVSTMNSAQLQDTGIQDMTGIARQVPVLEVQGTVGSTSTNFRIRRVGNLGNIPTFEPAVGVFVDGAFRSRAMFGANELFDIERIEILRGPQSTLYGKNTTAGVIGIYTEAPSDHFEWRGEVTGGELDANGGAAMMNVKGGISGPLSDSLRGSIGLSYANNETTMTQALGGVGEDANNLDRYSVRGQLQWDASEELSLRLIVGTVQEDDKVRSSDIYYQPNGPVSQILAAYQAYGVSIPCTDNDGHNRVGCSRTATTNVVDSREATLIGEYALANGATITSVTSWDWFDARINQDDVVQVAGPLGKFHDTQEAESWQEELRISSAGGETVDWLAGAFWYHNEFKRGDEGKTPMFLADTLSAHPVVGMVHQQAFGTPFPLPLAAPGQNGYLDGRQDTDYLGIFAQATWNISEKMNVTTGVRWQEEDKDALLRQWTNTPELSIWSLKISPAAASGEMDRSTDEMTWSVTPQYFLGDDTMVYATAAHGFKSGGFNVGFGAIPADAREFQDEDIMHYELGIKSELLDGRMRLAGSVFATDYDDYQDAAFVGAQFTVGNAEKAELRGAELETTVLLSQNLTADFAVSYADFKYAEHTSGQCYPGRAPDSTTTPGACDLSGEKPVNAPEWKTHLGLQYARPMSWGELYARGDWSWTDEYNTSFSADPNLKQDAYDWLSLRAGARWSNYELVAWVDNVLDETVANLDVVLNLYAVDGSYQSFLQAPRSYGVTFRVNY